MKPQRIPQQESRLFDELEALIDIGKALTSRLALDEIYQVVMETIGKLLGPQAWSLLIADEESRELSFEIVVSPTVAQLQGARLQRGEGIAGWVAEHGLPLPLQLGPDNHARRKPRHRHLPA